MSGCPDNPEAVGIEFDPGDPLRLYLRTQTGIFRSLDGGAHWSLALAGAGTPDRLNVLSVGADSSVVVQVGLATGIELLISRDGGDSWQLQPRPFPVFQVLAFRSVAATTGALLAGNDSGISRTVDGGATWEESNSGLLGADLQVFELDRQNPERLYALPYPGGFHGPDFLRSLDRGESWEYVRVTTSEGQPSLHDFLVDPNNANHYLGLAGHWNGGGFPGVTSSPDAGETWDVHVASKECLIPTELTLDPLQPNRLFVSGISVGGFCLADCHNFSSPDAGESWQCIEPDDPQDASQSHRAEPFRTPG